jgi:hypothetical protein
MKSEAIPVNDGIGGHIHPCLNCRQSMHSSDPIGSGCWYCNGVLNCVCSDCVIAYLNAEEAIRDEQITEQWLRFNELI